MNQPQIAEVPGASLVIRAAEGVPIACDMNGAPDTPDERLAEYGRLFAHALIDRQRSADAVEFTFTAKPGVAEWIFDLARRESACCPFFSYNVAVTQDRIVWRTSSQAGPEVQAFLDEFHALPEHLKDGLEGLFSRLRDRGVAITGRGDNRFEIDPKQRKDGLFKKLLSGCGC
jgi:hypothetical protein